MTPGPFQFCTPCNKNQAHTWISSLTYRCISCGKETKVSVRTGAVATDWMELAAEIPPTKKHTPQTHLGLMRTIHKAHRDHVNGNY